MNEETNKKVYSSCILTVNASMESKGLEEKIS